MDVSGVGGVGVLLALLAELAGIEFGLREPDRIGLARTVDREDVSPALATWLAVIEITRLCGWAAPLVILGASAD
ncbi:MAG: hypothetical protein H6707_12755 [Deltaproteobacteria bacterium]|nr:hypothetical protein [Deltaproteobacteria bacterium]